jgi:tetratricopeptide (TPR) repeat protein
MFPMPQWLNLCANVVWSDLEKKALWEFARKSEVRFTVTLDNLYKRLAVILAVTGIGLSLGWMVVSNLIVRGVSDQRSLFPREFLAAVEERFPNSARVNFRLASAEIAEGLSKGRFDAQAESHAEHAVNLSPWNCQARSLLATVQELNGKQEEAEKSLREAVKLAPNYAEVNWAFANLLLRRGKLNESFGPLRIATRSRADLLPAAIDTIWRSSGGGIDALRSFAGDDAEAMLSVMQFLAGQKLFDEAGSVFNSIDKQAKAYSPRSLELISALMQAGRFDLARMTWGDLMSVMRPQALPEVSEAGAMIWDGGFETDPVKGLNLFNWVIRSDKFAWVAIDRSVGRTGGRSLKVVFLGLDTTKLGDQVQQTIILKPGAKYRLECYAKAKDLVTPEGPRIAVIGQGGLIGESDPVRTDSDDWQKLTISFVAPADQSANQAPATLAIVRTPKFSYDDPTTGIIWFDDFSLVER